eukprot:Rhum_TRINITY_DN10405_c0_g1::Rhum_TRINITY_DN10405_c0_g1_i1::g.38336::m.38336
MSHNGGLLGSASRLRSLDHLEKKPNAPACATPLCLHRVRHVDVQPLALVLAGEAHFVNEESGRRHGGVHRVVLKVCHVGNLAVVVVQLELGCPHDRETLVTGIFASLNGLLLNALLVAHNRRKMLARRNALSSGQRRQVDECVRLERLVGVGNRVAEHKAALSVCVVNLNRLAAQAAHDVVRPQRRAAHSVVRKPEEAVQRPRRLETDGGDKGAESAGRPAHVTLHAGHGVARLETQTAGVVDDTLACPAHNLLRLALLRRVRAGDKGRGVLRGTSHGEDHIHALLLQLLALDDIDVEAEPLCEPLRNLRVRLRVQVVRRHVHKTGRKLHAFTDDLCGRQLLLCHLLSGGHPHGSLHRLPVLRLEAVVLSLQVAQRVALRCRRRVGKDTGHVRHRQHQTRVLLRIHHLHKLPDLVAPVLRAVASSNVRHAANHKLLGPRTADEVRHRRDLQRLRLQLRHHKLETLLQLSRQQPRVRQGIKRGFSADNRHLLLLGQVHILERGKGQGARRGDAVLHNALPHLRVPCLPRRRRHAESVLRCLRRGETHLDTRQNSLRRRGPHRGTHPVRCGDSSPRAHAQNRLHFSFLFFFLKRAGCVGGQTDSLNEVQIL